MKLCFQFHLGFVFRLRGSVRIRTTVMVTCS